MSHAHTQDDDPHWIVIANRTAAAGRVKRRWRAVRKALHACLQNFEIYFTEYPRHATELAAQHARKGARHFVTVGGDGTIHEVLTGILNVVPPDGSVTLGVIPMGTGGDFKRLLKDAGSLEDAVCALCDGPARPVDVGRIRFMNYEGVSETRSFINSTSFGLGGLVDKLVNETPKFLGGKTSFYIATLRALAQYQTTRVRLSVDGKDIGVHDIANVFVANGRYTGGGMLVGEHARLNDGLFEVSMIPDRGVFWMMRNVGRLYDGSYRNIPGIRSWQAKNVLAVHLNEAMGLLDVDGENVGRLDAMLEILPGAIRMPNLQDSLFAP